MRVFKRVLALFCILAILLSSLSSCAGTLLIADLLLLRGQTTEEPSPQLPENDQFSYSLSETDRQTFLDCLEEIEKLLLEQLSSDEEKINALTENLGDLYYHVATQANLAYIYHCLNATDAAKSEAYLYASAMHSDLYAEYEALCKRIDVSDAPGKSIFFADWSEEDLEAMREYTEEYKELSQANDKILVNYRSLSKAEQSERAPALYLQLIQNNVRIAALSGYDNYADYAYAKVYRRDYSPQDAEIIHQAVKSELLPICQPVLAKFQEKYSGLNANERQIVRALLEGEYTNVLELINGYLASFPEQAEEQLQSLFQSENFFMTSAQNADPGAFTVYLYEFDQPVCYFGPGYHDGYTIIHELGHYLSAFYSELNLQMDIAETQSQGNEWLFTAYLKNTLASRDLAETILYYQLFSALQTIVVSSIVDEFEQRVYRELPTDEEEFDRIMEDVCQEYGGLRFVKTMFADPANYWRAVVLESPCYYISYAFSMLVAFHFYEAAINDYEAIQAVYLDLAQLQLEDETTYCQWLKEQNLQTPFEEEYYQTIVAFAS